MKSKTLIAKQARRKTNTELVDTILETKKNKEWIEVSAVLSRPRRKRMDINLDELNKKVKEGESIVFPGKVLGVGELDKKIKLIALSFSQSAVEKLKKNKVDFSTISEEIKKNPKMKMRVLKDE